MHDWKSTWSAILTGLIGTFSSILAFQIPAALVTPQQAHLWLWITVACNFGTIIAKVWLGVITKNADASATAAAINNAAQCGPGASPVSTAELASPAKE